ncbi:MAG: SpoIID/LytB domain-containing protein [Nitrospirae bacterium]|nr:SpoIID/LytB domain-containing protein [Nitrospirota bacterium]
MPIDNIQIVLDNTHSGRQKTMRLLIVVLSVFLLAGTSQCFGTETIKVLILDGTFKEIPDTNERLGILDSVKGELLIGYTRYKGNIEVWRGTGGIYLISELPLEEYVEGVVISELSEDWETEAIKAQAVIARTYALYQKSINQNKKFHLTSSVQHQLFSGNNSDTRVSFIVKGTEGEVLTFNGKLIEAFYHSTCGGKTENSEEVFNKERPYLKSVKSECKLSPYQIWNRKIPFSEIEDALGIKGISDIQIRSFTSSGRVKELAIITNSNSVVPATEFRKKLGWKKIPSTDFTLKVDGDLLILDGRGYGHGVGLCQWGAREMARKGKTYKEILSFYYPGTTIELYEYSGF